MTIADFAYAPERAEVITGDTVIWFWDGPDTDHSVTADAGQAERFDSDPGRTPEHRVNDAFAHRFTQPGTFTYFCTVHSFMRGEVVVRGEPVSGDVQPPAIFSVSARPSRMCARRSGRCARSTRVTFQLDEAAEVTGRVVARGNRTVRRFKVSGRRGGNAVRIRARGLRRGLYRAELTATDGAGNQSRSASVRVRVLR